MMCNESIRFYPTTGQQEATCPARDKHTGKCYKTAWFEGKPGKAGICDQENCEFFKKDN